jgi:ribosome-associated protein
MDCSDMTADRTYLESLIPWLECRFSRSPGPGGQNVNKVATRVTLLFHLKECPLFSETQKQRIREWYPSRVSREGILRVTASRGRTQGANRAAAGSKLVELLQSATREPRLRRPTRPTRAAAERRMRAKQLRKRRLGNRISGPAGD